MTRDDRQNLSIKKWNSHNKRGLILAATGFGKTHVGKKAIEEIKKEIKNPKVLIITPTIPIKKQWENFLKGQNIKLKVRVVNSAVKDKDTDCHLRIDDELHNYIEGEVHSQILNIRAKYILGLTAGIENPPYQVVDRIPRKECVENNWGLSTFTTYNLALELPEDEKAQLSKLNSFYKYYESRLGGKFSAFKVANKYSKYGKILKSPGDYLINKTSGLIYHKNKIRQGNLENFNSLSDKVLSSLREKHKDASAFFRLMGQRKKLLCTSEAKVNICKDLVELFEGRKFITFAEHTEVADKISQLLEVPSYHSQNRSKYNRESLDKFKYSQVKGIASARGLNEGLDVGDCSLGINIAGNSKALDDIQRTGRVVRDTGERAIFINLYIPKTQDEKWLRKRQTDVAAKEVTSIDEIRKEENRK